MCRTIEDSILSGSLSYVTGGVLLATGQPKYIWAGMMVLAVGTMQWVDAMIWYRKSRGESSVGWSQIAVPTVLSLEIIVGYLGYIYYFQKRMPAYEPIVVLMVLGIFYLFQRDCQESSIDKDGYLVWCGAQSVTQNYIARMAERTAIMFFIFFPFFFFPDAGFKWLILGTGLGLWLYTVLSDSFGARWCQSFFIVDIVILVKLFLLDR
jgi:hypothetical protein